MGIDYYICDVCGETFNDCGYYISCDCGRHWCNDKCAKKDKYRKDKNDNSSCNFCRKQDFEDSDLLKYTLKLLNTNRKEIIKSYKTYLICKKLGSQK